MSTKRIYSLLVYLLAMKASIKIGSIAKIPIYLHITFLLILPFLAWVFASNPFPLGFGNEPLPLEVKFILGIVTAISLFACVLLHEIGHSLVALKYGIKIRSITLFLFGGVSALEELPREPRVELRVSIAGPATSLGLALLFYASNKVFAIFGSTFATFTLLLALMNLILAAFNILPAFPMDGGRILRAFLASRISYARATRKAALLGKLFAFIFGLFGFLLGDIILLIIAFFIFVGASEEETTVIAASLLEGVKVRNIMSADVFSIPPSINVSELLEIMLKKKYMGYPVVEKGLLLGIVTFNDVQKISNSQHSSTKVEQIMSRNIVSISPEDDAATALKLMNRYNIGRLIVKEGNSMVGIITKTDLIKALALLEFLDRRP
ncbi:MAG: CBS domain-containing protein [Methanocellales archaeon]